jgi:hypothetical protein
MNCSKTDGMCNCKTGWEGSNCGTDTAISWGVGILTGIALATLASTPIGISGYL